MKFELCDKTAKSLYYYQFNICFAIIGIILLDTKGVLSNLNDQNIGTKDGPVVYITNTGKIQGKNDYLVEDGLGEVDTFLGIPYAQAPVGALRFKKPQALKLWHPETREAISKSNSCPQNIKAIRGLEMWNVNEINEDCLYLNVFLPERLNENSRHAVMVWIHGGDFHTGSSTLDFYDARFLAVITRTIIISFNYRLGALGFFSMESESIQGNVGLHDQVAVLQWVKDNIGSFGGDAGRVTLFGQGAGAASVSLHLFSELSDPLFHKAILQSGSALSPWAFVPVEEAHRRSFELAVKVGCDQKNVEDVVACMIDVDVSKIIENQWVVKGLVQFPFVPTVDKEFLKETPEKLLSEKKFKVCPILAGSNKDEATFFLASIFEDYFNPIITKDPSMYQELFTQQLSIFFSHYPQYSQSLTEETKNVILNKHFPTDLQANFPANLNALNRAITDSLFICPMNTFLHEYAKSDASLYSYYYTQPNEFVFEKMGVTHGSEVFFLFNSIIQHQTTESTLAFSKEMMKMWSNFAKTSDPNDGGEGQKKDSKWPVYTTEEQGYLELNQESHGGAMNKLREDECHFWTEEISKMQEQSSQQETNE